MQDVMMRIARSLDGLRETSDGVLGSMVGRALRSAVIPNGIALDTGGQRAPALQGVRVGGENAPGRSQRLSARSLGEPGPES